MEVWSGHTESNTTHYLALSWVIVVTDPDLIQLVVGYLESHSQSIPLYHLLHCPSYVPHIETPSWEREGEWGGGGGGEKQKMKVRVEGMEEGEYCSIATL